MICEKYDQIYKKLGTYFYLSLHTLRKDLVFYKHSSRISVQLDSQYGSCNGLRCLQLVLNPFASNLNLRRIIRCEYTGFSLNGNSLSAKFNQCKFWKKSKNIHLGQIHSTSATYITHFALSE